MFIDLAKMEVEAGKGGDGIVAYRRELKVERGGPFGGSGGKGGSIIFKGSEGLSTLLDLRYNRVLKGNPGEKGRNKGQTGANAEDTIVLVPVGTTIFDDDTNKVIGDITKNNQEVVVCKGGRGGRGNMAFATGILKCPDFCEKGEPGEKRKIRCELRVLADCGLVGFPSVGKSTLIASVSQARPKIAAYHFTTLVPNLGMVRLKDGRDFVMADLPGIIEGAHQGAGLGLQFLRHIERCRVIVHVIDMAATDGRDPYDDYVKINKELEDFNKKLLNKPQIIIANKMEMESSKENLEKFKSKIDAPIYPISAMNDTDFDAILTKLADMLDSIPSTPLYDEDAFEAHVLYKFKKEEPYTITKENDEFVIRGEAVEKLFKMTKFTTEEAIQRFAKKLRKMGIDDKLIEMGCKEGDMVRILDFYFEFK